MVDGVFQPRLRVQTFFAYPVQRQVNPAVAGVFAHIAGDVGELHRNAQLAGPRQRAAGPRAHDPGHHRAHGAGHAGAVAVQRFHAVVAGAFGVPAKTVE